MGIFDWFKRRQQKKTLNQLFNKAMSDIRIFEQRQDYKGAVIAAFGGLTAIARNLINLTRAPYQTGREFGMLVAEKASISVEVMDDFLSSFEIARYTERDINYDDYQQAIQRLDICFRGIREQGVILEQAASSKSSKKVKARKQLKIKRT